MLASRFTAIHAFITAAIIAASFPSLASERPRAPVPEALEIGADVVLDSISTLAGATRKGTVLLGKSSLSLGLDSERAGLWSGGRAHLSFLGTFGDEPSVLVGDLQVADNIEAPNESRLLEAWYEQSLGARFSVLAGIHDFNSEFDVADNAAELLNSSFGMGPEISQVGPSIFPSTYPGMRLRVLPSPDTYVLAAGYEGLPFRSGNGEVERKGRFYAIESGWIPASLGGVKSLKVAGGAWSFQAAGGEDPEQSHQSMSGAYLLAEASFATRKGRTLGAFVRAGRMAEDCHAIDGYVGLGMRIGAPLQSRPDDVVSLGVARAQLSAPHRVEVDSEAETTIELTWVVQIRDWIAVQPDLQYVMSPASEAGLENALVGGVRLILSY